MRTIILTYKKMLFNWERVGDVNGHNNIFNDFASMEHNYFLEKFSLIGIRSVTTILQ